MRDMFAALVVLWLGSEAELADHRDEIAAWAQARQRRAELLRPTLPSYDGALVNEIELLLEEARSLPAAAGTPAALQRAEALLLEHPELPQAAWLLAERYAIEAQALATTNDVTGASRRELAARALALEGVRAATVGAAGPVPEFASAAGVPAPRSTRPHDRVFIDGVALDAAVAQSLHAPGRHHAQLWRGALPAWAGWITLEPGHTEALPDPALPCSALDLADVAAGPHAAKPASGVRCERWAVARPGLHGGVELAECAGSRCDGWRQVGAARLPVAPMGGLESAEPERGAWPAWATWSLIGAGALAATGIVLWQVGAFERNAPGTEFVFTGPSAPAFRF